MNRRHTLSACATIVVALAFYFIPLGVMAACLELGWHA
ncbi:hypothetical protein BPODLACK_03772 [Gordonia sp. YY1]|nr:hypothetical protein BPODLACK_03772 [Gordonia sp. YY1]